MPRHLVLTFGWLQLIVGFSIAAAGVYAYLELGPALREGTHAAAATATAASEALKRASGTIQARRRLVLQVERVLAMAPTQINQLEALASGQAEVAPQYAKGLQSSAALLLDLAGTTGAIAVAMDFEVPSGVTVQGTKIVYTTSRPLASSAKKLGESAGRLKDIGTGLSAAGASLLGGAQTLDKAIAELTRESRALIGELRTTINLLSSKELPDALDDLKTASESLRSLSTTIDRAQGLGTWLLLGWLLISLWCLLNGLTTIGLASSLGCAAPVQARDAS